MYHPGVSIILRPTQEDENHHGVAEILLIRLRALRISVVNDFRQSDAKINLQ